MHVITKGLVYCASQQKGWAVSHAIMPTPYRLTHDVLRIYCSFCDNINVGRIGYVDVSAEAPAEIIGVSTEPVLDIGQNGTFDDNGVVPVSVVAHGSRLMLYYIGYQLAVKQPYSIFGGLAISHDGGHTFVRHQQSPIIDRCDEGLFIRSVPYVIHECGRWKMWYAASSKWIEKGKKSIPACVIRYLESNDGIRWGSQGILCLAPEKDEFSVGRPYVVAGETGYSMYFSVRGFTKNYRIGYAESPDGKCWTRKDHLLALDPSQEGWDSQDICYPAVIAHGNNRYLFYNGNEFGKTGFGVAELMS